MTYELFIGDQTYSSWSLRGWLMLEKFNLPFKTHMVGLYSGTMKDDLAPHHPARFVPFMRSGDGVLVGDTAAMAETLAERHPDKAMWPTDPALRARARWLGAEMHSAFGALRSDCPMNLANKYSGAQVSDALAQDVNRMQTIWNAARELHNNPGPWLFGDFSLADVFAAPYAARVASYDLPINVETQLYVSAHLNDPAFRRWRAMGLTKTYNPEPYKIDLPTVPWPVASALEAKNRENGPSENQLCPYSDKPVTHYLEIEGRVFGFCNAFCRDKTLNDPEAWPKFMALYHS